MEELLATLTAMRNKLEAEQKFMAALQGVDLEEKSSNDDITNLKGARAKQEGFGIGLGLGHVVEE